jgi:putative membrane protein
VKLILRWLVSSGVLAVTIFVLQALGLGKWTGGEGAAGFFVALFAVLIMSIVNAVIRPILKLMTMPLTCATFGLFSLVINGLMFWLVGAVTGAFTVKPLGAVLGSIVMAIVGGIANAVIIAPQERGS